MTALDADRVEPVTDELPVLGVPDAGWQRLDPRMLAVRPVLDLARLLPVVLFLLITGGTNDDQWRIVLGGLAALAVLVAGVLRWSTTTYRITGERVELRTGLLRRHHRSVHRDRIRTADLTSTLVHRAVGLAVVRIGTGTHAGSGDAELHLDAVGHAEAERLRALLLREPGDAHDSPVVARLDPAWVRFAPLTFSTVIVVGAIWAAFLRLAEELGWSPEEAGRLGLASGPVTLGLLGLGLLALAAVGSSVIFVEGWWGYRLTRADDGGLVVRRGLLTHRSLTLEGRRIRGVELTEPLLLRLGRGARALALTSGLHAHHGERPRGEHVGALAPALPRAEAHRIAAATLGVGPEQATAAPLTRHPRAARTRRYVRAVVPCLVLAAGVVAAPVPSPAPAIVVGVLLVVGLGLGAARWAALGHALTPTHLVARSGAWTRRTVVLRRDGVIGWQVHQSVFQRRVGLVTLVAVSAAGHGHYVVLDVGVDRAIELVEATTPGLLTPFVGVPTRPSGALVTPSRG